MQRSPYSEVHPRARTLAIACVYRLRSQSEVHPRARTLAIAFVYRPGMGPAGPSVALVWRGGGGGGGGGWVVVGAVGGELAGIE